jgi:hypothetical protein
VENSAFICPGVNLRWLVGGVLEKDMFNDFPLILEDSKTELFHSRAPYQTHLKHKPIYKGLLPPCVIDNGPSALTIKPNPVWRYLGFFFDEYLNYNAHVDRCVNKPPYRC